MRILLVENDITTAQIITMRLKREGFCCYHTDLGEDAIELATMPLYDFDLIILALMLRDIDGLTVLRRIRDAGVETPVLILSGLTETDLIVKSLRLGADDYLTKPFHIDELVARINAIVRRVCGHSQSVITTGKLAVDIDTHRVEVNGTYFHTTPKECQILELLSLRKWKKAIAQRTFLDHLYDGIDEPQYKIINVFIMTLRKKLSKVTGGEHYIETIKGCGFRLVDPASVQQGGERLERAA